MPRESTKNRLTPRQEEVRRLTKSGLTPQQIAAALGLTTQRIYQLRDRLVALGEIEKAS
jgi:DNA-binding CsgD family transcriptional regulator